MNINILCKQYQYQYLVKKSPYISLTRIEAPQGCSLVAEARSLPKRVLLKVTRQQALVCN